MTRPVTVCKLGGSYAHSPLLRAWLDAIGRMAGAIVVVPGGGPFADTVRAEQERMGFDDAAAHEMGLLAMSQYGCALACLGERFVLACDGAAIGAALARGLVPVWSPWPMLRGHPEIPTSWDVTSDSLALWLARTIDAARVVLIKQRTSGDDLVDTAFPRFRAAFSGGVGFLGPHDVQDAFSGEAI